MRRVSLLRPCLTTLLSSPSLPLPSALRPPNPSLLLQATSVTATFAFPAPLLSPVPSVRSETPPSAPRSSTPTPNARSAQTLPPQSGPRSSTPASRMASSAPTASLPAPSTRPLAGTSASTRGRSLRTAVAALPTAPVKVGWRRLWTAKVSRGWVDVKRWDGVLMDCLVLSFPLSPHRLHDHHWCCWCRLPRRSMHRPQLCRLAPTELEWRVRPRR